MRLDEELYHDPQFRLREKDGRVVDGHTWTLGRLRTEGEARKAGFRRVHPPVRGYVYRVIPSLSENGYK